jgi:hypothetical protein
MLYIEDRRIGFYDLMHRCKIPSISGAEFEILSPSRDSAADDPALQLK